MGNNTMEVYVNIREKATIDPEIVIEKLISKEIGSEGWVFEKDGEYFMGWEQSAGQHSIDVDEVITEEKYDYVIALQFVLKNLKA